MVSNMAYGTRVRRVQLTRGNRQGNNAFLEDSNNNRMDPITYVGNQWFIKRMFFSHHVSPRTLEALQKLVPTVSSMVASFVYEAVRAGNRKIAGMIIKAL